MRTPVERNIWFGEDFYLLDYYSIYVTFLSWYLMHDEALHLSWDAYKGPEASWRASFLGCFSLRLSNLAD